MKYSINKANKKLPLSDSFYNIIKSLILIPPYCHRNQLPKVLPYQSQTGSVHHLSAFFRMLH